MPDRGQRRRRRRRLKSLAERLLQDGRVVDEPTAEEREELRRLEQDVGLIEVSRRKYFLCIDHNDDADLVHAWKRDCDQKIELDELDDDDDPLQHEDDLKYVCPECGRVHWPRRRRRTLYDRAVISMPAWRVVEFFGRCVKEVDENATPLDDLPVFRLHVEGLEVYACLLDECTESKYATRNFASTFPVVFVTGAPRVYSDRFPGADDWLEPVPLHELARGGAELLRDRLLERGGREDSTGFRDAPARAFLPLRRPGPRVVHHRVGVHDLVIGDRTVTLNGIEVLSSRAKIQVAVVGILALQRIKDLENGCPAEKCTRLLARTVLKRLGESVKTYEAETVAKYINRARSEMVARHEEAIGVHIDEDDIIESSSRGFRLNPEKVAVRFA